MEKNAKERQREREKDEKEEATQRFKTLGR